MKLYYIIHLEKNIISWDVIVKLNTLFWNCLTIRGPRLISEYIMTELFNRHISLR